jgi:hypothetical protein
MTKNDKTAIVSSFRKYSRLGLANDKLSPFDAYDRIRGVCKNKSEALDLLAVYDTMRLLRISNKTEVIKAVYAVYFGMSGKKPKKNEISERVLRHASENYCDERTVYRQLEYARKLYLMLRSN